MAAISNPSSGQASTLEQTLMLLGHPGVSFYDEASRAFGFGSGFPASLGVITSIGASQSILSSWLLVPSKHENTPDRWRDRLMVKEENGSGTYGAHLPDTLINCE